jgi:hypothetical protein
MAASCPLVGLPGVALGGHLACSCDGTAAHPFPVSPYVPGMGKFFDLYGGAAKAGGSGEEESS